MKRIGNVAANKIHNPRNVKPPIPVDADEVDSAMERFIRQKYESKILEYGKPKPPSREDPSYISKPSYDAPPPLPPKPGRKFGFGLRSSSRSSKSSSVGLSIDGPQSPNPSYGSNKQSRTMGLTLNDGNGSLESKLAILRDMGFSDSNRNATILKGFDGDLDKTVETLVRLGEGNGPNSGSRTPGSNRTTPGKISDSADSQSSSTAASATSPFDKLDSTSGRPAAGLSVDTAQPQIPVANGGNTQAGQNNKTSYNPFDKMSAEPTSSTSQLELSFQNLQVSQPLFPNTTGGYPSRQPPVPFSRYQHSMTPPATSAFNSSFVTTPSPIDGHNNPFFPSAPATANTTPSSQPHAISPTNPFFSQATAQNPPAQPNMSNPMQVNAAPFSNNPYAPQHANTMPVYSSASAFFQQQLPLQQQQQQQQQHQLYQLQPQPTNNPYATLTTAAGFQQPSRMDKSSILALYNFSQPPPTIPEQPQNPQQPGQPEVTQQQPAQPQQPPPQDNSSNPMPSQSNPTSQSRNPFGISGTGSSNVTVQQGLNGPGATALNTKAPTPFTRTHMSQESIDVGNNQSGRYSPDIFASLSARHG